MRKYVRKTITLREQIRIAQSQGIKILYSERKGGGVNISRIGSTSYKGRAGNQALRSILGIQQTEAQLRHQASKAFKQKPKTFGRPKKEEIPRELLNQINRINNKLRKREDELKKLGGKKVDLGRATRSTLRWNIQKNGLDYAMYKLTQLERYSKGLAHVENVQHFRDRVLQDFNKVNKAQGFAEVINKLNELIAAEGGNLTEDKMKELIAELYEFEKRAISAKEFIRRIKGILGI